MCINNMISKLLNTATNLFADCALHHSWKVDILEMETAITNVAENFTTNLALSSATIWKLDQCFIEGDEFSIAVCKAGNLTINCGQWKKSTKTTSRKNNLGHKSITQ